MEQKQTFEKRSGTTDRGADYEHLYLVYMILKLTTDDRIENFYISSNDKQYGSFDDVVLMIKYFDREETEVYAIQLKQSKNKVLRSNDLTASKGHFSITQYLQDYNQNLKDLQTSVKMVLYTNRKAQVPTEIELCFEEEKFNVGILNVVQNNLLETSKQGVCYMFDAQDKYDSFFRNFFVYSGQADVDNIEAKCLKMFKDNFNSDESVFKDYLSFIIKWSFKEGSKAKLDKVWMQQVLAVCVLSPFIKPLTFSEEVSKNAKILRDAISKFHVTVFHKDNYDKIKNLWKDIEVEKFGEVNETRTKFQIRLNKITKEEDLKKEDKEVSKLLWLLGQCPLVVEDCPQLTKIITFCKKSFVVLTSEVGSVFKNGASNFRKLVDLKIEERFLAEMLNHFTYSIEGQKETPLRNLMELDEKFASVISTDKIVEMLNDPLLIGTKKEVLMPCHIARNLSKVLIHPLFLEELKNTLVLLTEVENFDTFKETLKDVEVIEINKGTSVDPCVTHNKVIYVSRNEYNQEEFDDFCSGILGRHKCHQLKYLNSQCLEWIRSKNGAGDLDKFQMNLEYNELTIHESVLLGNLENPINIVCGNSGMGKTTLMKSLKINSCSSVWTILIYVRNHALQLRQQEPNKFLDYILTEKCKEYDEIDREVFKTFTEKNKVRLIWDGLDEVSDESLKDILNVINTISAKGIKQWVTSRNNIRRVLENRFKTLSRQIQHFNIKEQKVYIRKRLDISEDELYDIFVKIKTNIQPFSNSDILGIPLQIYMLTELFCRNKEKYSDLFADIFTMLDLYENFVQEKFNLYYIEKIKFDLSIEKNYQKYRQETRDRIDCYKRTAFNLYLKNSASTDGFLEEIKKFGDSIGFISTVSKDSFPEFCHNSFGEYFAALYLLDNNPQKSKDKKFISDQKFNNIRFFLDLMMAQNSKAHIAVLYKNSNLLDKCVEDDLNCKDRIGRSTLEVACAWSKNYKVLNFEENIEGQFNFKDKYMSDESTEKLSYKDVSKCFNTFDKIDIRIKRLMLLLPSFIPLYINSSHRFDEKSSASILYYSVKFDYVIIFKYIDEIPWLKEAYQNFETKCLLSFAMTCKSRQVLEEIVANQQNRDLLRQNLNIILASCKPEFDEVFSLLVKNAISVNELIFLACWEGKVENVQYLLQKGVQIDMTDTFDRMPLHYACDNERYGPEIVELLIELGSKVNASDSNNQMPLHYACMNGNGFKIVTLLTDRGAAVNILDVDFRVPLHYACDNEDDGKRIVELLVSKGAELNVADVNNRMPVHYACMNSMYGFRIVEFLSGQNAELEFADENGRMPIHYACKNYLQGTKIVKLMVEKRLKVDARDKNGCTPMHHACERGKTEIVDLLISCGCRIDVGDNNGQTPIHYACKNFSHGYETVKLLSGLDVNINYLDFFNRTPIHYACENGKFETIRFLIDNGAEIDIPDSDGRLPIHFACENKDYGYEIVKLLISKGTKVDPCDSKGKMPMHCACETGNVYVVIILLNEKAKVNTPDGKGKMPIHYACMNWNFGYEIVTLLSKEGANLDVRDSKGRMPIHYACETGNLNTVMLLMEKGARVDVKDKEGYMPEEYAQKARNFNVVRFLSKGTFLEKI